MSSNKSKKHIHKYHKVLVGLTKIWACALPTCSHHMPLHMTRLVEGKASYCWGCDKPIILDLENMQDDKPKCDSCKHGIKPDELTELVKGIN